MWDIASGDSSGRWESVESPVKVTINDICNSVNGPCAVANRGYVIGRAKDGSWGVIVENGPGAKRRALHSIDVTDDGKRVWFGGAGGALGYYDVPTGEREDFSQPKGYGTAWHALTVSGPRNGEKILLADGSGHTLPGDVGTDGIPDWGFQSKPNDGNALYDLTADDDGIGYGVDGSGNVWKTTADGWERIGIDRAQNSFYAVEAVGDLVFVGAGNGRYWEWDGRTWTPFRLGGGTIHAIHKNQDVTLAGGSSGTLRVRRGDGDWHPVEWNGNATVNGVLVHDPPIAVGQNGTIAEGVESKD